MRKAALFILLLTAVIWVYAGSDDSQSGFIAKVIVKGQNSYEVVGDYTKMNESDVARFRKLISSEDNFLQDVTKPCVFVPEYVIRLDVADSVEEILFSPYCKQIMINGIIRDCDPITNELRELIFI